MKLNEEMIQAVWDEINGLAHEDKEKAYARVDKNQHDMVKFINEQLEGFDMVYVENVMPWLFFTLEVLKAAYKTKRIPKIPLNILHEKIEGNEGAISPNEMDEFYETSSNVLLRHIVDLVSHVGTKPRRASDTHAEEDNGFEEIESLEANEYSDFSGEDEEGDEDYLMFKEMYDEHEDDESEVDGTLSNEDAKHALFLAFKSIMDAVDEKIESKKK